MKTINLLTLVMLSSIGSVASADATWGIPMQVNDENTKVTFDVDTTWHVVYGKTKDLTGSVSLNDPKNLLSIKSDIHFPVKSFDTGWGLRNDSLHENMKADTYPEVLLKTNELTGDCTPQVVSKGICKAILKATLTICDVTKDVPLEVSIEEKGENYLVKGEYAFKWAEFNVKDPSMIAAKVDPTVRVQYSIDVPKVNQ